MDNGKFLIAKALDYVIHILNQCSASLTTVLFQV